MEQNLSSKSLFIWFGAAIVLVLIIVGAILLAGGKPGQSPTPNVYPVLATPASSDQVVGNKDSKIVLLEFSDYQCPACALYEPMVEQVIKDYSDKIQFVYRNFPLSQHKNAIPAASAAEAAGLQGKFWPMHDLLFAKQTDWAESNNPQQLFDSYAQSLNFNVAKFKTDMQSPAIKTKIENDLQTGLNVGVNATPTFFLNGKQLTNLGSYNDFKSALDAAIASQ